MAESYLKILILLDINLWFTIDTLILENNISENSIVLACGNSCAELECSRPT